MITILFLFMQKLRKRLTLTSVLAGRKALRMRFYPRDAMLARVFATATCLSTVRPSVRLSV